MIAALELQEPLQATVALLEQVLGHARRNHGVAGAVYEQAGHGHGLDTLLALELILEADVGQVVDAGNGAEQLAANVGQAGERVLDNKCIQTLVVLVRQVNGHRAAYTLPERYELACVNVRAIEQVVDGRLGVQVEAALTRRALAQAVATVFD